MFTANVPAIVRPAFATGHELIRTSNNSFAKYMVVDEFELNGERGIIDVVDELDARTI